MELREASDHTVCAAVFSKDTDECQLNMPVASNKDDESDSSISSEKSTQSSKQNDIFHGLSGLYAEILLVITGASVLLEILHHDLPLYYIHDYFFLYIFIVGILLLLVAYAKQCCKCFLRQNSEDNLQCPPKKSTRNGKDFNISLYFKIAGFVFGSVVILVTSLEIVSIFTSPTKCLSSVSAFSPILRCIFILLQICILKNPIETIRNFGCLRNFALMHLLAANGATWIRLLLWESASDWEDAYHLKHNSSINWKKNTFNFTVHSLESDIFSEDVMDHYPRHVVHYTSSCYWRSQKSEEVDVSSVAYCLQHSSVGFVWGQANRFLYPFMCQYYFVLTGILYILWYSCNMKRKHFVFTMLNKSGGSEMRSRSTKGFFLGCIIFAVTVIIVILFFTVRKSLDMPVGVVYIIIFSSSSFASLLGLSQVRKMLTWKSYNIRFIKLFQKIGLLSLIAYGTCSLICEGVSKEKNIILGITSICMIIHGCSQYLFIIEVSRKKVDVINVFEKPGRQAVAFLIFCNMSLWLLDSFVNWNNIKYSSKPFTSPFLPVITRCLLPIVSFYRFHSFTVLVDAWSKAYE